MPSHPSGIDPAEYPEPFGTQYRPHLQHLQFKGLRPKTIEAYIRAMRRIGPHFQFQVSALSPAQLADYFIAMKREHSWSGVTRVECLKAPRRLAPYHREPGLSR